MDRLKRHPGKIKLYSIKSNFYAFGFILFFIGVFFTYAYPLKESFPKPIFNIINELLFFFIILGILVGGIYLIYYFRVSEIHEQRDEFINFISRKSNLQILLNEIFNDYKDVKKFNENEIEEIIVQWLKRKKKKFIDNFIYPVCIQSFSWILGYNDFINILLSKAEEYSFLEIVHDKKNYKNIEYKLNL